MIQAAVASKSIMRMDDDDEEEADNVDDDDNNVMQYDDDDDNPQTPIEAWRQVHSHLVRSVAIAREALAAKKAQRRFWMEEICANLTEEGNLTPTSVWKRPDPSSKKASASSSLVSSKKATPSKGTKGASAGKKRKKPTTPDSVPGSVLKRSKKNLADDRKKSKKSGSPPEKSTTKIRLKLPTTKNRTAAEEAAAAAAEEDDLEDEEEEESSGEDDEEEEVVAEVEAQEIDEDDEEEEEEDDDNNEDQTEDEDDSGDEGDNRHSHGSRQSYPPHDYHHGGHWGGQSHNYMVGIIFHGTKGLPFSLFFWYSAHSATISPLCSYSTLATAHLPILRIMLPPLGTIIIRIIRAILLIRVLGVCRQVTVGKATIPRILLQQETATRRKSTVVLPLHQMQGMHPTSPTEVPHFRVSNRAIIFSA